MVWEVKLTSDNNCDLVPAGSDAVADLADKSGVDRVVHFQHLQHVVGDLRQFRHLSWHAGGTRAGRQEKDDKAKTEIEKLED